MEENPKIKLLIDLGLKKLKDMLGEAKRLVAAGSAEMKSKLDEIKIGKPDTSQFNQGLNDMKRAAQQAKNEINNNLNGIKAPKAGNGIKDKLFDVLGNGFKGGRSFAEGGEIEGLSGTLSEAGGSRALVAGGAIAAAIGVAVVAGKKLWDILSKNSKEFVEHANVIRFTFDTTGQELHKLTAQGMATADVFKKDFNSIVTSVKNTQDAFSDMGITAEKAFKLVQDGLIASNGLMNLEDINQYIYKLKEMGLNADNAIAFIAEQSAKGNMGDKLLGGISAADANIRAMRKSTAGALSGLGLNPDKITKELSSGALQVKDVITQIAVQMDKVNVKAQQAAVNLFNKNLTKSQIESLKDMGATLDELKAKGDDQTKQYQEQLELTTQLHMEQGYWAEKIDELSNKYDTFFLKIKVWFYDMLNRMVAFGVWIKRNISANVEFVNTLLETVGHAIDGLAGLIADEVKNAMKLARLEVQNFGEKALLVFQHVGQAWEDIKNGKFKQAWGDITGDLHTRTDDLIAATKNDFGNIYNKYHTMAAADFDKLGKTWDKAIKANDSLKNLLNIKYGSKDLESYDEHNQKTAGNSNNVAPLNSDVGKIAHESQQQRNINITFDSYIKGDVITQNQNIRNMNSEDFQRWLADNFQRLLLSVQQSYGGN